MKTVSFSDGVAIQGTFPDPEVLAVIVTTAGQLPLVIAEPPYGNIVDKAWDRITENDRTFCQWMIDWTRKIEEISLPGSALYVWGGVGLPRNGNTPPFRPFLRYLVEAELQTGYELSTPITWKKKRAYGIQWGYLFTREELAYFVLGKHKHPRKFTVPLLEAKRGYAGYDKNYPAKSEFFRRTNVWDDVTEIMRGKTHINQKPRRLMEIPIEVHTEPGEWVLDPFAGSGTTAHAARALGRRFVVVEKDPEEFEKMVASLRGEEIPLLGQEPV
jgi:DNA modification methylase